MPLGGQLAPPQQQQGGQPQAQQQQDDAGMTEEEMLQEAINRYVRRLYLLGREMDGLNAQASVLSGWLGGCCWGVKIDRCVDVTSNGMLICWLGVTLHSSLSHFTGPCARCKVGGREGGVVG